MDYDWFETHTLLISILNEASFDWWSGAKIESCYISDEELLAMRRGNLKNHWILGVKAVFNEKEAGFAAISRIFGGLDASQITPLSQRYCAELLLDILVDAWSTCIFSVLECFVLTSIKPEKSKRKFLYLVRLPIIMKEVALTRGVIVCWQPEKCIHSRRMR